jgi:hypothetical protein
LDVRYDNSVVKVTKIPKSITQHWAKFISPYSDPSSSLLGCNVIEMSYSDVELDSLGSFDGILMDPPWNTSDTPNPRMITPEELVQYRWITLIMLRRESGNYRTKSWTKDYYLCGRQRNYT